MLRRACLALLAVTVLAGCGDDEPTPATSVPSAQPSVSAEASPSAGVSPTPSPSPAINFTVDGAGPYTIGANLEALKSGGVLDKIATGAETCPANTTATGTDVWKDIQLQFRPDGVLYLVVNRSKTIPTPSGARLGMTLAAVSSIYGSLGKELNGGAAYLVTTTSGRGILFDLDQNKKVFAMIAGDAAYLKSSYEGGTDFC
ncbi:hypothetical protein [Catellatospora citrea]|uniref:Lipoprotein n=1 Tax=Catellatospora citrea TaxID=53366 RepID=A0A8J3NWM8_9ACTN|nr:hypothetical protein [Catellatospora citrea]RKE07300.1 hypothetical protein C8E86_2125 [Catellatospora citrea]GIF95455.1 hypothetical protein Cci01nite_05490 [Catellatospora citrea]